MISFGAFLDENKSGDHSLHDWFKNSKSSDGKPGWVQLGGRYAGKSCAKQPGQTTKPKCGSSKMFSSMSKKEKESATRRKRMKDPNANRSGKAINVATEEFVNEDACTTKVKSRYSVWPSAYASGALVKCRKVGAANWGNKSKKEEAELKTFKQFMADCWSGYKAVPGKKKYEQGSCVKEGGAAAIAAATAIAKKKSGDYDKEGFRKTPYKNPDAPNKKSNAERRKEMNEDGAAAVAGPTNAVSSGAVAGTGGAGGEPGVKRKKINPIMLSMGKRKAPQ